MADAIEEWRHQGGTTWVWLERVYYKNREYWENLALATRRRGYLPAYDHRGGSGRGLWRDGLAEQDRADIERESAARLIRELIAQAKIHRRLAREAEAAAGDCDMRAWEDPQREAYHSRNAESRRAEAAAHYDQAKHLARIAGANARGTTAE